MFFSKDVNTANKRLKELSKTDKYYLNKKVILSDIQIKHIDGWQTFKII